MSVKIEVTSLSNNFWIDKEGSEVDCRFKFKLWVGKPLSPICIPIRSQIVFHTGILLDVGDVWFATEEVFYSLEMKTEAYLANGYLVVKIENTSEKCQILLGKDKSLHIMNLVFKCCLKCVSFVFK